MPTDPIDGEQLAVVVTDPVDRLACVRLCTVMAVDDDDVDPFRFDRR